MGLLDSLTATAVSLTVAGNTGVTPFLTLLLVACLNKFHPDLLSVNNDDDDKDDGATEMSDLLSSWPSLLLLFVLSALEFVAKCVPVVDEIMDAAMTFVVPVVSTVGSLSTMGLFATMSSPNNDKDDQARRLNAVGGLFVMAKVVLIIMGIGIALGMHLTKMILRMIGEGCFTGILTALETMYVLTTVTLAICIKPIAIVVAAVMALTAGRALYNKFFVQPQPQPPPRTQQQELIISSATEAATEPETSYQTI